VNFKRSVSSSSTLCAVGILCLSHYVTFGTSGAGKDGDARTHIAGVGGCGTAVREIVQGSEVGQ